MCILYYYYIIVNRTRTHIQSSFTTERVEYTCGYSLPPPQPLFRLQFCHRYGTHRHPPCSVGEYNVFYYTMEAAAAAATLSPYQERLTIIMMMTIIITKVDLSRIRNDGGGQMGFCV